MKFVISSPLYVGQKARRILQGSIMSDTTQIKLVLEMSIFFPLVEAMFARYIMHLTDIVKVDDLAIEVYYWIKVSFDGL